MNKDIERRKFNRVGIIGSYVQYKVLNAAKWSLYQDKLEEPVKNISTGGVCFDSKDPISPNTLLGLNIKFNEAAMPIKIFGRVAWSRDKKEEDKKFEIGVIFSGWTKDRDKLELNKFIEDHLVEGTIYKWS